VSLSRNRAAEIYQPVLSPETIFIVSVRRNEGHVSAAFRRQQQDMRIVGNRAIA
jgi:hypothetical protein